MILRERHAMDSEASPPSSLHRLPHGGSNSLLEAVSTQGGAPLPLNRDVIPPLVMTKRSAAAVRCKSPTPYAYENGLYVTPMP